MMNTYPVITANCPSSSKDAPFRLGVYYDENGHVVAFGKTNAETLDGAAWHLRAGAAEAALDYVRCQFSTQTTEAEVDDIIAKLQ